MPKTMPRAATVGITYRKFSSERYFDIFTPKSPTVSKVGWRLLLLRN